MMAMAADSVPGALVASPIWVPLAIVLVILVIIF